MLADKKEFLGPHFRFLNDKTNSRIVKVFYEVYTKNDRTHPSPGVLQNGILSQSWDKTEKKEVSSKLEKILKIDIEDPSAHEKKLITLIKAAIVATHQEKISRSLLGDPSLDNFVRVGEQNDELVRVLQQVSFANPDVDTVPDILGLIERESSEEVSVIPSGFKLIDEFIGGGFGRQEVSLIAAPVNQGKSVILVNIAANIVRAGKKVLFISLEGKESQPKVRFISNFARIKFSRIKQYKGWKSDGNTSGLSGYLKADETKRIKEAQDLINGNIGFCHEIKRNEIEDLIPFVRDKYKDFKFDAIVVDYIQKVRARKNFSRPDLELGYIVEEFERLASELNISAISAVQIKNEGIKEARRKVSEDNIPFPLYREIDVADSKKIIDNVACCLTFNRTDEEKRTGRGRIGVLKSRESMVDYQVGYEIDWDYLDISGSTVYLEITGEGEDDVSSITSREIDSLYASGADILINQKNEESLKTRLKEKDYLKTAFEFNNFSAMEDLEDLVIERNDLEGQRQQIELEKELYSTDEYIERTKELKDEISKIEADGKIRDLIKKVYGENLNESLIKIEEFKALQTEIEALVDTSAFDGFLRYSGMLQEISSFALKEDT